MQSTQETKHKKTLAVNSEYCLKNLIKLNQIKPSQIQIQSVCNVWMWSLLKIAKNVNIVWSNTYFFFCCWKFLVFQYLKTDSRVHFGRYRVSHKRKKSWITMLMLLIKLLKISINLLINWINWYNKSLLCIEWFLMYVNRELNRERTADLTIIRCVGSEYPYAIY